MVGGAALENSRRHIAVLVIDDSDTILKVVGEMLYDGEYQAFLARSMDAALNINVRDQVDVILVDIVMPEMDGLEGIQALREMDPDARIIGMSSGDSSRSSYDLLRCARRAGADAVIRKPFKKDQLFEVIKQVSASAGVGRLRVLAIDDSRTIGKAIEQILDNTDRFVVSSSLSADDAPSSPQIVGVDVIVTDIFMPGESGIDVIEKVHDNWPGVKVIAMSAGYGGDEETRGKALLAADKIGAAATITKPFKKRRTNFTH